MLGHGPASGADRDVDRSISGISLKELAMADHEDYADNSDDGDVMQAQLLPDGVSASARHREKSVTISIDLALSQNGHHSHRDGPDIPSSP